MVAPSLIGKEIKDPKDIHELVKETQKIYISLVDMELRFMLFRNRNCLMGRIRKREEITYL